MEVAMSRITTEQMTPARLPAGYRFRRRIDGEAASGFPEVTEQAVLVHTKGNRHLDWAFPITVHMTTKPDAVLVATEKRPGVPLDLGRPNVNAIYHDGWWGPPVEGGVEPQWLVGGVHSVTVRVPGRVYAIRGPRAVSMDELIEVARSLPLASN
jgi:hypothetical protein